MWLDLQPENRFRCLLAGTLLAMFGICFASLLTGRSTIGYRDTVQFYLPGYTWQAQQWGRGSIPLWNPLENLGTATLDEATGAVFYPPKLLFALPISAAWCLNLYVVLHVALAFCGVYLAGRCWHLNGPAAALAGLAYAFGGAVLFQCCNVVYLVGAAWLPFSLWAAERVLSRRNLLWAIVLGVFLALTVLGGDAQSAYHSGLAACGLAAVGGYRRRAATRPVNGGRWDWKRLRSTVRLLLMAAVCGILLSAVQVLPALRAAAKSERSLTTAPLSLYQVPEFLGRETTVASTRNSDIRTGLFGRPTKGTHGQRIYDFSVEPWRLLEMAWPNVSGRTQPINRRWLSGVPAEGRIWTPSLYFGLVPLLLVIGTLRWRGGRHRVRWWSWLLLLALLGSFGWYGPGWLWHQMSPWAAGDNPAIGEPTGGLYWAMVVALPGYDQFRYPAKLLVPAMWAAAMLAGQGLHDLCHGNPDRLRRRLALCATTSALLALCLAFGRTSWSRLVSSGRPDELFGPLDVAGAWWDLEWTCLHTGLVCLLAGLVLWRFRTTPVALGLLFLISAGDLACANHWLVATAPMEAIRHDNKTSRPDLTGSNQRIYRPAQRRWVPEDWLASNSKDRRAEVVRWDRATRYPKFHLLDGARSLSTTRSLHSAEYQALLRTARRHHRVQQLVNLLGAEQIWRPAPAARNLTGPGKVAKRPAGQPGTGRLAEIANFAIQLNPNALPRAWIVHKVEVLPASSERTRDSLDAQAEAVLCRGRTTRELRQTAVVAATPGRQPPKLPAADSPALGETCEVLSEDTQFVRVAVHMQAPGLLVVSDQFDPEWVATVESPDGSKRTTRVWQTNLVMRGAYLQPGRWLVTFRYRPVTAYWGGAISALGWLALIVLALRQWALRARRLRQSSSSC